MLDILTSWNSAQHIQLGFSLVTNHFVALSIVSKFSQTTSVFLLERVGMLSFNTAGSSRVLPLQKDTVQTHWWSASSS